MGRPDVKLVDFFFFLMIKCPHFSRLLSGGAERLICLIPSSLTKFLSRMNKNLYDLCILTEYLVLLAKGTIPLSVDLITLAGPESWETSVKG